MTNAQETKAETAVDVAIIGGGMAGMTLGVVLAGASVRTAVLDRVPYDVSAAAAYDGRASAIAHGSANILKVAGIWDHLAGQASPITDIRVADGHPLRGVSSLFLHYDHRDVGAVPFGYIIENRAIRAALQARGQALADLADRRPVTVERFETGPYGAKIHLADGESIAARLIVAADGRHSAIREQAGISHTTHLYRQKSIVCTVAHERDHHGVAVELFLPGGPFAMLPMTERRSNVVWSERADLAETYLGLDEAAFLDELGQRFGDWLGPISLVGPRFAFPLGVMQAARYTDRRLALLGDAAHAIHPIAGQGLNLGLRDVAALAELIVDAGRLGLDIGAETVLSRYARWRRFDNMMLTAVTDGLNRLFSNDIAPVRLARDLGLAAVDRMPPAKKFLMRHAMGMVGDLPRLVRGEAL